MRRPGPRALAWLVLWLGLGAVVVAAVTVGLWLVRAEAATGPACPPPDPNARPVVRLSAGEIRALAALAWAESRGEPDPYCAMLAVSSVVVNRMKTNPKYFGATITQVIHRPHAFSPFGKDDPNRARMGKIDESSPLFVTALLAAIAAVSGTDNTMGSTHFHSGKAPRWTARMLVKRRIGNHTFLKPAGE